MPISCSNLSFRYVGGSPVLQRVTCAIHPARITALVGPNGAGKSTLLRLMAGLLAPVSGRVTLRTASVSERMTNHLNDGGHTTPKRTASASDRTADSSRDIAHIPAPDRARHIAYVAQRSSIAFAFPARQVVAMGRHTVGHDEAVVDRAIQLLDLGPVADRPFNTLSAGQQQRVSIARAVAQLTESPSSPPSSVREPRFLLADEPLAALDPRHVVQSLDLFRSLAAEGIGIVLVLHDLTSARRVADDAILLNCGGTMGASGPAATVLTPETLGPAYGVTFETVPLSGGQPALIPIVANHPVDSRSPQRR